MMIIIIIKIIIKTLIKVMITIIIIIKIIISEQTVVFCSTELVTKVIMLFMVAVIGAII